MIDYQVARRKMVQDQLIARGIRDSRLIEAMGRVPRHEFVDAGIRGQAYEDRPLTIGSKQTISQPFMVALMTEILKLDGTERVLEIGTGSGYQTAILCELAKQVYSIERIAELSNRARKRLYQLGYMNFELRIGDGTEGWREQGPFDAIIVSAASPSVPEVYLKQLKKGGRLVIPVGGGDFQQLLRLTKEPKQVREEYFGDCRFVKLVGQYGWKE